MRRCTRGPEASHDRSAGRQVGERNQLCRHRRAPPPELGVGVHAIAEQRTGLLLQGRREPVAARSPPGRSHAAARSARRWRSRRHAAELERGAIYFALARIEDRAERSRPQRRHGGAYASSVGTPTTRQPSRQREPFGDAQADAQPGEGSWADRDGDQIERRPTRAGRPRARRRSTAAACAHGCRAWAVRVRMMTWSALTIRDAGDARGGLDPEDVHQCSTPPADDAEDVVVERKRHQSDQDDQARPAA